MQGNSLLARAALAAAIVLTAGAAAAQAAPTPKKPHSKNHIVLKAEIEGAVFAKQLASQGTKNGTQNQAAANVGIRLHAYYHFMRSPWSLGAAYYGAGGLYANGPCSQVSNYGPGGACTPQQQAKTDNTLPAFGLNTLGEAFVQYQTPATFVRVGNQLLNTPFALPDDSRLKPVLFRAFSSNFVLGHHLRLTADRITRFEHRTSSAFLPQTFVTGARSVPGALYLALSYAPEKQFSALLGNYQFYNIASLTYGQARFNLKKRGTFAPYVAVQDVQESQAGAAYAGRIANSTLGFQFGAKLNHNVSFALSSDTSPWHSVTVAAANAQAAAAGIFTPAGGTPVARSNGNGTFTVYYGGVASPYTDAYAGDALFTSIPTNSMAQRRSAGTGLKGSVFAQTRNQRFQVTLARALFDFGNGAGSESTAVSMIDAYYYFGPHTGKAFHGFWLRNRWIQRTQTNTQQFGGIPLLNYNNFYMGYNF